MLQKFTLFLLFVLFGLGETAFNQHLLIIDSTSQQIQGTNLAIYLPKEDLSFKEVLHAKFKPMNRGIPNLGMQDKAVWMKFSVLNKSPHLALVLSIGSNTLTDATLYFKRTSQVDFDSLTISNLLPIGDRIYKSADFIFRLDVEKEVPQDFYLRVKSRQPIFLPINLNFPPDQLVQTVSKNWANGIYFGMILIMAIYNFFLFLSIKERSYIFYVAFILTSGLTQLSLKGITFQYFWPTMPLLEANGVVFWGSLGGISALLFSSDFLRIKKTSKIWHRIILSLIIPFLLSILCLLTDHFQLAFLLLQIGTSISSISILIVAIYIVVKTKNSYAIFFLVSSSFLILGSIIFILKDFNVLPFNFFTDYSVQFATAIQMTLLSFALANRINILKRDKERSRLKALKLARENEDNVKRQNVLLEKKVEERTYELNKSLQDLKLTQSQLVSAEKMSSLGQLTAGIAHEINNPINFVAANVKPLERDILQVFDMISVVENIYGKEISLEEKQKEFSTYKDSIDFDFLKVEIAQLLKGINEGACRTADIVKGLRIFSRHDDAEFRLSDINAGIASTLTISNNLLNGIKVATDFGKIPEIEGHSGSLNQAFLNIITNAIFAIHEKFQGREGGLIHIKTYTKGQFIYIVISDNGIGMSETTKAKIFEPFFTTKPVGIGTGLGMSIVFSLVQQHQGQLTVNSEPTVGTELSLRLFISPPPLVKPES